MRSFSRTRALSPTPPTAACRPKRQLADVVARASLAHASVDGLTRRPTIVWRGKTKGRVRLEDVADEVICDRDDSKLHGRHSHLLLIEDSRELRMLSASLTRRRQARDTSTDRLDGEAISECGLVMSRGRSCVSREPRAAIRVSNTGGVCALRNADSPNIEVPRLWSVNLGEEVHTVSLWRGHPAWPSAVRLACEQFGEQVFEFLDYLPEFSMRPRLLIVHDRGA